MLRLSKYLTEKFNIKMQNKNLYSQSLILKPTSNFDKMTELSHSNQKPSKYHYHIKSDSIYGDKKLKICGKCIIPVNLSTDLKQLNKLTRSSVFENEENLPVNFKDKTIQFNVLDLSTDRQSGLNLPIIFLPNDLFAFKQLKRLHLDCNLIKNIPEMLGENLVNLEILTITSNQLQNLPKSMSNLSKLKYLHLANNNFKQFPEIVCQILSLNFLDLSSNKLEHLPDSLGYLKNLKSLLLFENRIRNVPKTIGDLSKLETLWLGNNKITTLPMQIIKLTNLDWDVFKLSANIDGNQLVDPPQDVCSKGLTSIKNYYQSKNKILD